MCADEHGDLVSQCWTEARIGAPPITESVAAGHGDRRLPIRVWCKDCGEAGQLQVRPPMPTRSPTGSIQSPY